MTAIVPRSPALIAGVIFVLALTLLGIFVPLVAPHDPSRLDIMARNIPPGTSITHPFGTDQLGRDILSRLIYGLRIPIILGGSAVILGTASNLVLVWLGAKSSAFKNTGQLPPRGFLNYSLLRLAGAIFLINQIPMIAGMAFLGLALLNVALVVTPFAAIPPLSLIYWSVRSQLALSASTPGENAPLNPMRIAFRECRVLLPITYSLAFLMGLFLETPLSFLGVGVPPGESSLGNMISEGRNNLIDLWWISLLPVGFIALAGVAFLAIVLPIRRVQKQSDLFVQPDPAGMNYAGFWVRMASITVDGVAQIVIGIISFIPLSFGLPEVLGLGILITTYGLYTLVFLGGYRDSLGHRLLRIKVVRSNGERVGLGRSIIRGFLILILSGIGVLAILFSRRRRALYDVLSDTVVVKRGSSQPLQNTMEEPGHPAVCPQCGGQTRAGSNFCTGCGAELLR